MTKEEILSNAALYEYPLYFSNLNKKPVFNIVDGVMQYSYAPQKQGVVILDYGKVEFNVYAPDAKAVRVAGWGGTMPGDTELTVMPSFAFSIARTCVRRMTAALAPE